MAPIGAGEAPSIAEAVTANTMVMPRRISPCGTRPANFDPTYVPIAPPISRGTRRFQSTPVTITWPIAAAITSGTACTRSVPTSRSAARVGYSSMMHIMMTVPEPTEVMPTISPPMTPTSRVISGLTGGLGSLPVRILPAISKNARRK